MKNFKIFIFTLLVVIGQGELFAQKNVRNFTRKSAQLTDSIPVLNAKKDWLITVASLDSLIGGSKSVGEFTVQFSDGLGGFLQYDSTFIDDEDTIHVYFGTFDTGGISYGINNLAYGQFSVVFGGFNTASGNASFCGGHSNTSSGMFSATFGGGNIASGENSTCLGTGNVASGENSTCLGTGNFSRARSSVFMGEHSVLTFSDNLNIQSTDTVFCFGNGSNELNRSNALTLRRDGALTNKGAFGSTARETYVGSSDDTIANNVRYYRYNPASTVTSATIYLPPYPFDGQELIITGGGTITSGNVISTMTIAPNVGQSVLVNTHVLKVDAPITMYWDADDNLWITISN